MQAETITSDEVQLEKPVRKQSSQSQGVQLISDCSEQDNKERTLESQTFENNSHSQNSTEKLTQKLQNTEIKELNRLQNQRDVKNQLPVVQVETKIQREGLKHSNIQGESIQKQNIHQKLQLKEDQFEEQVLSQEEEGENKYFQDYDSDGQNDVTAVYDQNEIKQIANNQQQDPFQELNEGILHKQVLLKSEQMVEDKLLLVLWLLFRKDIYNLISKQKYTRIDLHPANRNKIRIYGSSKQQMKQISIQISNIINSISVVKLNIKPEQAMKMKHSKELGKKLIKQKLVIFKYGFGNQKNYYLGGKGSQPYISSYFKQIRNFKFRYFRVFPYVNSRSYKIILNYIVQRKQLISNYSKYQTKCIELVDYIPSFGQNFNVKKQKQKSLCFLMTSASNANNFSPKQMELQMIPFIKNTFYSIVLIFKQGQQHLPKLNVDKITFKYVAQRKFNRSYIYILSTKQQFLQQREEIIKQISKLQQKNKIYGARYFKGLAPQQSQYIKPDQYKKIPFPTEKPYSFSIMPKRIVQQTSKQEQKKEQICNQNKEQICNQNKEQIRNQNKEQIKKQSKKWKFHEFDWRQHLRSIQSTEVSFFDQENKL